MIIIVLISFFIILLTFVSRQQYILPVLLCLEGIILLVMLSMLFNINNQFIFISLIIVIMLTIRVSRASLGLRLLVTIRRKEGNDSSLSHLSYIC